MELRPGKYQTRSGRIVELLSSETREKVTPDGSKRMVVQWRGNLYNADAKTVESQHFWEDTLMVRCLGAFAQVIEGVPHQFDLTSALQVP